MLHINLPRISMLGHFPLRQSCYTFPHRLVLLQSPRFLSTSHLTQKPTPLLKSHRILFHDVFRIHLQQRHSSSRPPRRPSSTTSFPQFTPRPLKPLYQNTVFLSGLGFVALLIWSPIPGWILLAGIGYGFFRLFRFLKRAQDAIFNPLAAQGGLSSTSNSFLDALFTQDPRTREVAARVQEMSMDRVERAIEYDEGGIRSIFPETGGRGDSGEFHFSFPSEVSMVNATETSREKGWEQDITEVTFEVRIKFMVYLASLDGRKGAEITARADVIDEGVRLKSVEVKGGRGKRVVLQGISEIDEEREVIMDSSGVGKGEGEGKTIDATKWTSR